MRRWGCSGCSGKNCNRSAPTVTDAAEGTHRGRNRKWYESVVPWRPPGKAQDDPGPSRNRLGAGSFLRNEYRAAEPTAAYSDCFARIKRADRVDDYGLTGRVVPA